MANANENILICCEGRTRRRVKKFIYFIRGRPNDIERDEEVITSSSEPKQVCENPRIEENEPRPSNVNRESKNLRIL